LPPEHTSLVTGAPETTPDANGGDTVSDSESQAGDNGRDGLDESVETNEHLDSADERDDPDDPDPTDEQDGFGEADGETDGPDLGSMGLMGDHLHLSDEDRPPAIGL
jgi:hypothetical protein